MVCANDLLIRLRLAESSSNIVAKDCCCVSVIYLFAPFTGIDLSNISIIYKAQQKSNLKKILYTPPFRLGKFGVHACASGEGRCPISDF